MEIGLIGPNYSQFDAILIEPSNLSPENVNKLKNYMEVECKLGEFFDPPHPSSLMMHLRKFSG
jgi:hypothetical protein